METLLLEEHQQEMLNEISHSLSLSPKAINPKYFYDEIGSRLFEEICLQPEYYPTRTEIAILESNKYEIATLAENIDVLIEFGSGASKKVRSLLNSVKPASYVGIDISKEFLEESTKKLAKDYDWLDVSGLCMDLCQPLDLPELPIGRRLGFYPGSSIGNFSPNSAVKLLKNMGSLLGLGGALLIGVDLKKPEHILYNAYNDAAGKTAQFNLNVLARLTRDLGAKIDLQQFEHIAFYNASIGRIEMHLKSLTDQDLSIDDTTFHLSEGEMIHTENSYKYTTEEFIALADRAGLKHRRTWLDSNSYFGLQWFTVDELRS
jgi:dimethylhistidine N-methyltransferase